MNKMFFKHFSKIGLLVFIVIISGCQPMVYEELSGSDAIVVDEGNYELTASDDGAAVKIRFKAISNARSYGFAVNGGDISTLSSEQLTFEDGYYIATINRDFVFSSGEAAPVSSSAITKSTDAGSVLVTLYASTKKVGSDWIVIKSVGVEISLDNVVPSLYELSREKDSVILGAENEASKGHMEYLVTYGKTRNNETFSSADLPYTLTGIGSEAINITVSHKLEGGESYGALTQALTISKYDERQAKMDISIKEGAVTIVSEVPSSYAKIGLFTRIDDMYQLVTEVDYQPTAVFSKDSFGNGFYAGKLYAGIYNASINDEDAVISQQFEYVQDIDLEKAAVEDGEEHSGDEVGQAQVEHPQHVQGQGKEQQGAHRVHLRDHRIA